MRMNFCMHVRKGVSKRAPLPRLISKKVDQQRTLYARIDDTEPALDIHHLSNGGCRQPREMNHSGEARLEFSILLSPAWSEQLQDLIVCPGIELGCPAQSDCLSKLHKLSLSRTEGTFLTSPARGPMLEIEDIFAQVKGRREFWIVAAEAHLGARVLWIL